MSHFQKLGKLGLKNEIQSELCNYFALLDEPRKVGYVVAQFLRPQQFYQYNFIQKYYDYYEREARDSYDRQNVSEHERKLFAGFIFVNQYSLYLITCVHS
jgi:hypothetical protein